MDPILVPTLVKHGFIPQNASVQPAGVYRAVADYQRFHDLPITGNADKATVRHMAAPRICQLPDLIRTAGPEVSKWPVSKITWNFRNPGDLPGLDFGQCIDALSWAFQQWENVCGVTFENEAVSNHAMLRIECVPIDAPGGLLAYGQMADNTMGQKLLRFDTLDRWRVCVGQIQSHDMNMEFCRVACHEIGHVLGMPHLAPGSLMQPLYSSRIWAPQTEDISEARLRYPCISPQT